MRISPSCWGTNAEPSFFHQNIRVRLASFLYAKQRPEPSPCISAQDKRPERLATSPPSSRGAGTEAPSGGWGPGAERGPHSCTRLLQSYPPPEPQPREQPETGNACYQGLIRETKSREGPLRSALKPLNHGAARSHLAEAQSTNSPPWPADPPRASLSLLSPLASYPSMHSTAQSPVKGVRQTRSGSQPMH